MKTQWHELVSDALSRRKDSQFETRAIDAYDAYNLCKTSDPFTKLSVSATPLFWSSIQTVKPALFFSNPEPRVIRRCVKYTEEITIQASEILEENLKMQFEHQSFAGVMNDILEYYLIAGLGQVWIRIEDEENEQGEIISQEIIFEPVHYCDFIFSHARRWEEVQWVARAIYKTKKWVEENYGKKVAESLDYDTSRHNTTLKPNNKIASDDEKSIVVRIWEIWDKQENKRVFIADDAKTVLDESDVPLDLRGFFPCPKPLFATPDDDTLFPICDYFYVQNLLIDINRIDKIIALCERNIRPKAMMNGRYGDKIKALLNDSLDSDIIQFNDWIDFQQAGGMNGNYQVFPIDSFVTSAQILYQLKEQKVNQFNEVLGISDIVRGRSNPIETATAQQLKSNYTNLRLEYKQKQVTEFVRDAIEIAGEIIAETFEPSILMQNANIDPERFVQDVQYGGAVTQAIQILRDDLRRNFAIDIETDSTLKINEQDNRQSSQEYLQAVSTTIQQLMPLSQITPAFAPVIKELVLHVTRQHSNGRRFESQLERTLDQLVQQMMQPPQPQPDIQQQMLQMNMQIEQAKLQLKGQEIQMKAQESSTKAQLDMAELQLKQREQQIKEYEAQLKELKLVLEKESLELKSQQAGVKLELDAVKIQNDKDFKEKENQRKVANDLLEIQTGINLD